MIPTLPCGTFSDGDTPAGAFYVAAFEEEDIPHHVGEYRIETVIRALESLKACGYEDVEIGSIEHESLKHLILVGLTDEPNGRKPLGCVAVCPVVMSR